MKTQSSELQRVSEERYNNVLRHIEWLIKSSDFRYGKVKERMDMYRDKSVCEEYEFWLDNGRG